MRASLSVGQLAVTLLSITPVISASQAWPNWFPEMDALAARQDDADVTTTSPPKTQTTPPTTTPKKGAPITSDFNTGGKTESPEPKETGTDGKNTGKAKTTTEPARHTEYDARLPPGNVVMTKPSVMDPSSIYKIGADTITWGWNYTNLQGEPTAIDVLILCASVSRTWTLSQNMTFTTAATFTWDTKKFKEDNPKDALLTENYKLMIHDSDSAFNAPAEAGYLAPFSGFQFGLYEPQPYLSFQDGWECGVCSGAGSLMSDVKRRAVGGAVAMSVITVLSFTWFVAGFGGML